MPQQPPRTIPPLLHPYTSLPPPTSLILLTSVLNASTNWLLLRFLCGALASSDTYVKGVRRGGGGHAEEEGGEGEGEGEGEEEVKVVFVSFMRDFEFWRREGGKCGLDLPRLLLSKRLFFVDGLTALFGALPVPFGQSPVKGDGLGKGEVLGVKVLRSARGADIEREIREVVMEVKGAGLGGEGGREARGARGTGKVRVVLVLDQPDLVLAAMGDDGMGMEMAEVVASLRSHVHSTIITTAADFPLLQAPTTPLEINHAAFVVGLAHLARWTVSLRGLDTGTARDVSGVLRVTRGVQEEDEGAGCKGQEGEERELLYFVGGDGGVRVFERGA